MLRNLTISVGRLSLAPARNPILKFCRQYAAPPKRFYKNTSVICCDGKFEVTLDNRKLKTPSGSPFILKSEPLAIAVAAEWDAQKDTVERSRMHLTSLCNTVLDNPTRISKHDMVHHILNFLPTDTILFQSGEDDDLYQFQCTEWDPIINWFNERYETNIVKSRHIQEPVMSDSAKMIVSRQLLSYSEEALHAFVYAVDTLKSMLLAFACIDKHISVEKAVQLARLEEEFQLKFWGRVEWAHDLNQQDLQARVAAAVLFIHFNTSHSFVKEKLSI